MSMVLWHMELNSKDVSALIHEQMELILMQIYTKDNRLNEHRVVNLESMVSGH